MSNVEIDPSNPGNLRMSKMVDEIARSHTEFFNEVKSLLPLEPLVFYPGSGKDKTLTRYFESARVVHLDRSSEKGLPPNSVVGVYENVPFKNDTFDMLYICDNHGTELEFNSLLNTLKKDGIVVFDALFSCGPYIVDEAITHNRLRPLGRPSLNIVGSVYQVFQKL